MVKYLFIVIFLIPFVGKTQSYSKVKDVTKCKQLINTKAKKTSSISGDFTEVIHSSMFNSEKKATGRMSYKREDKG